MRDLKSKKMPAKPMQESMADEELELDMPMSDEEEGSMEADEEALLPEDEMSEEASPFEQFSDDEIIEEFKKRGLSLEDASMEQESPEEDSQESGEESY